MISRHISLYFSTSALSGGVASQKPASWVIYPGNHVFKNIQDEEKEKRRPVVLFYRRLNAEPLRDVYLPPHHAGIMRRIYERTTLRRNILSSSNNEELPEHAQVNVKVQTEASRAFLRVVEYGLDLEDQIRFRLKELCTKRIDCIYMDLPLGHPAVQRYCAVMEMLGFFFGGILPELQNGNLCACSI